MGLDIGIFLTYVGAILHIWKDLCMADESCAQTGTEQLDRGSCHTAGQCTWRTMGYFYTSEHPQCAYRWSTGTAWRCPAADLAVKPSKKESVLPVSPEY